MDPNGNAIVFIPVSKKGAFDRSKSEIKELPLALIEFIERVMSFIAQRYEFSALHFFSKKGVHDKTICEVKDLVYKMLREQTNCNWRLIARLLWMENNHEINCAGHRHKEKMNNPKEYRKYISCYKNLRIHFSPKKKIRLKPEGKKFVLVNELNLEQKLRRNRTA